MQRLTVEGRPADVVYLNDQFLPVADPSNATLARVLFADKRGGALFCVPANQTEATPCR